MKFNDYHKYLRDRFLVDIQTSKYDVRIDRKSIFGNPFKIGKDGTREEVINKYYEYILKREDLLQEVKKLRNKILGCWCYPKYCHGDILIRIIYNVR